MTFAVEWTVQARADLVRLHGHLVQRVTAVGELDLADRAASEIEAAAKSHLARTPYIFRKAWRSPLWRELIIPFGGCGHVALYEIKPARKLVLVHAVRHQMEADYH
jgi:plasmid stabilization system protein ParE